MRITYLSLESGEECEVCEQSCATMVLREGPFKVSCCDDCKEIAVDSINDRIVDQFG